MNISTVSVPVAEELQAKIDRYLDDIDCYEQSYRDANELLWDIHEDLEDAKEGLERCLSALLKEAVA